MSGAVEPGRAHPIVSGRYRLLERIGQGGMGQVWRARDEMLDRLVAVKEIIPDPSADTTGQRVRYERTRREARAAARINHPNVVRIYDVVEEDRRLWIVMELVRGPSLAQVAGKGPLGLRETVRIGLGLATALRDVHAAGVLHRDVKPANVHLEPSGRVVLMDFGIAALRAPGETTLTTTGVLVGTPGYMAPERLTGGVDGPPGDLWSLGATLYAAVTGRAPFAASSAWASMRAVLDSEPRFDDVPEPLRPLLTALLRKDPAARSSADEVIEELTRLGGHRPLDESSPEPDLAYTRQEPAIAESPSRDGEHGASGPADGHTEADAEQPVAPREVTRTMSSAPVDAAPPASPPPTTPEALPAPPPDPATPRNYIPRRPMTAFARRPHRAPAPPPDNLSP
ncbi:serine/threonine-protein kinase [Streptomyces sp. NPDC001980]|uniref:serine/threonine-protein kinase n=1 Tax=Streptomyces sp. NPDC001980 TaxID=3157126 RepID=UPI00332F8B58